MKKLIGLWGIGLVLGLLILLITAILNELRGGVHCIAIPLVFSLCLTLV